MRKTTHGQDYGIQLGPGKLADLDFADDIALLSNTRDALQYMTTGLQNNGRKVGLRISSEKTKAMVVGEHQAIPLTVDQQDIEYVDKFQYLGSYMSRTGDVDTDIQFQFQLGWAVCAAQRLRPQLGSISHPQKNSQQILGTKGS